LGECAAAGGFDSTPGPPSSHVLMEKNPSNFIQAEFYSKYFGLLWVKQQCRKDHSTYNLSCKWILSVFLLGVF